MKINVTYNNRFRVIDFPKSVYFVGVTVIYKGSRIKVLDSYTDNLYKQEEETVFDENLKIIFHYYSDPMLKEVLKEFSGFDGIRCIEIENKEFYLSVCI